MVMNNAEISFQKIWPGRLFRGRRTKKLADITLTYYEAGKGMVVGRGEEGETRHGGRSIIISKITAPFYEREWKLAGNCLEAEPDSFR